MTNARMVLLNHDYKVRAELNALCKGLNPLKVVERGGIFPYRKELKLPLSTSNPDEILGTIFHTEEELEDANLYERFKEIVQGTILKKTVNKVFDLDVEPIPDVSNTSILYVLRELASKHKEGYVTKIGNSEFTLTHDKIFRLENFDLTSKKKTEGLRVINICKKNMEDAEFQAPLNINTLPILIRFNEELHGKTLISYSFKKGVRTNKILQRFVTEYNNIDSSMEIVDYATSTGYVFLDILCDGGGGEGVVTELFKKLLDETEPNRDEEYFAMMQVTRAIEECSNTQTYYIVEGTKFNTLFSNLVYTGIDLYGFPTYVSEEY
ncbi:hypothetical protein COF68_04440 [Bacillus toyonensis]|uniref:hypothetical protein n=1 Tax=Bacillus toyonensis TaxID=155322 RepID=UPI000BFCC79D|nr:hypothetical protein [Bacillus toyonensis]PHE64104.1 hypothetical protein COF68_04440 [Bacillus toyonensis]